MKKNTDQSELSKFIQGEDGYLLAEHPDTKALEVALRAVEGALLCLGEGNISRAAQVLYNVLPRDRKPTR
jgi:hypothetical protein